MTVHQPITPRSGVGEFKTIKCAGFKTIKNPSFQAVRATDTAPAARPKAVNGTRSYMPNIFGLMMAGHLIQTLLKSSS